MHQPYIGETFAGTHAGAWLARDGERRTIRTRAVSEIDEAVLYATDPVMFQGEAAEAFERVAERCRLRRFGSDCYGYCLVAMGQADLVIENGLQPTTSSR